MKTDIPPQGNLRDVPFARIVGHQARTQGTGAVEMHYENGIDRAFFLHGVPQGASTHNSRVRIGDVLTGDKTVTDETIGAALAHQKEHGGLLGSILVERGDITAEILESAFAKQSHLTFLSFFSAADVPYEVRDGLVELTNFRPMPMLPLAAIYRGLRDHAAAETCYSMLGAFAFSRLSLTTKGMELLAQLSPAENSVASKLETPHGTLEIAEKTKLPRKTLAALILALDELEGLGHEEL